MFNQSVWSQETSGGWTIYHLRPFANSQEDKATVVVESSGLIRARVWAGAKQWIIFTCLSVAKRWAEQQVRELA